MALKYWFPLNNFTIEEKNGKLVPTHENSGSSVFIRGGRFGCHYKNNGIGYINTNITEKSYNCSVSFWIKINNQKNNTMFIGGIFNNNEQNRFYIGTRTNTEKISFGYGTNAWNANYETEEKYELDKWYNIVLTAERNKENTKTTIVLYWNNEKIKREFISNTFKFDQLLLLNGFSTGYIPNASMFDFRFYDHVLCKKEIKELGKGLLVHESMNYLNGYNFTKGAIDLNTGEIDNNSDIFPKSIYTQEFLLNKNIEYEIKGLVGLPIEKIRWIFFNPDKSYNKTLSQNAYWFYNTEMKSGNSLMPSTGESGEILGKTGTGHVKISWGDNFQNYNSFGYTGSYQTFTTTDSGTYKMEAWGAQGNIFGGKGAYTKGEIQIEAGRTFYIYVGNNKKSNDGTVFNGGGQSEEGTRVGGGSSDIRLISGQWNNIDSLKSRIMVAAGGGGHDRGAPGGTLSGLPGWQHEWIELGSVHNGYDYGYEAFGHGGSQFYGGSKHNATSFFQEAGTSGGFGFGGKSGKYQDGHIGGGGGGGFFGGGGSLWHTGGGGGSSYISGHPGCNNSFISECYDLYNDYKLTPLNDCIVRIFFINGLEKKEKNSFNIVPRQDIINNNKKILNKNKINKNNNIVESTVLKNNLGEKGVNRLKFNNNSKDNYQVDLYEFKNSIKLNNNNIILNNKNKTGFSFLNKSIAWGSGAIADHSDRSTISNQIILEPFYSYRIENRPRRDIYLRWRVFNMDGTYNKEISQSEAPVNPEDPKWVRGYYYFRAHEKEQFQLPLDETKKYALPSIWMDLTEEEKNKIFIKRNMFNYLREPEATNNCNVFNNIEKDTIKVKSIGNSSSSFCNYVLIHGNNIEVGKKIHITMDIERGISNKEFKHVAIVRGVNPIVEEGRYKTTTRVYLTEVPIENYKIDYIYTIPSIPANNFLGINFYSNRGSLTEPEQECIYKNINIRYIEDDEFVYPTPLSICNNESFTLETWMKLDNIEQRSILLGSYSATPRYSNLNWEYHTAYGKSIRIYWNTGTTDRYFTIPSIENNQWNHTALVINRDSDEISAYWNGQLIDTIEEEPLSEIIPIKHSDLFIGSDNRGATDSTAFKGALSQMRFWKGTRTQQQIADNMYNFDLYDGNMLHYWKLNSAYKNEIIQDHIGSLNGEISEFLPNTLAPLDFKQTENDNYLDEMTICCWLKVNSLHENNTQFFGDGAWVGNRILLCNRISGDKHYFSCGWGDISTGSEITTKEIELDKWYFIVLTCKSTENENSLKLFIDGDDQFKKSWVATTPPFTPHKLQLGASNDLNNSNCEIADFKVFGKILTQEEILDEYNFKKIELDKNNNIYAAGFKTHQDEISFNPYGCINANNYLNNTLIENGFAEHGSNKFFTNMTYKKLNDYEEVFEITGINQTVVSSFRFEIIGNERDFFDRYKLEYEIRGVPLEGDDYINQNRFYGMIVCYDEDNQRILQVHINPRSNTQSTVASYQPQNGNEPGRLYLTTNIDNWSTLINVHNNTIRFFPDDHKYPDWTYSRFTYRYNTIKTDENNIKYLELILGNTYPEFKPGDKIDNTQSGGTYSYIAGGNVLITDSWKKMEGTTENNHDRGKMRYGTKYIAVGFLLNRPVTTGENATTQIKNIRITNLDTPSQNWQPIALTKNNIIKATNFYET